MSSGSGAAARLPARAYGWQSWLAFAEDVGLAGVLLGANASRGRNGSLPSQCITSREVGMPVGQSAGDASGGPISVLSRRYDGGIAIVPWGEIDIATAPAIEEALRRARNEHDTVALDLRQVSFMDSTGLQMMLAVDHEMRERGGRLIVVTGPPQVDRLLALTGVAERLTVVDDLPIAGGAVDGAAG